VYKDTQHDIILSAVTCSLLPYSVRGVDNDWWLPEHMGWRGTWSLAVV